MLTRVIWLAVVVALAAAVALAASRPPDPPPTVDRPVRSTNLPDPVPAPPATDR